MIATTLVIEYPNGTTQVVKPNIEFFKGDWGGLAQSIASSYLPRGERVKYEVK